MSLELSDYEKVRLANIQRNQDYLKSLGFDKRTDSVNQLSNRKDSAEHSSSSSSWSSTRTKRSKISVKNESNDILPQPLRRSSRAAPVIKGDDNIIDHDDFDFPDPIPLGRVDGESDSNIVDVVERTYPALSSEEFGDHSCRIQITAQSLMDFIIVKNIAHSEMMKVKVM